MGACTMVCVTQIRYLHTPLSSSSLTPPGTHRLHTDAPPFGVTLAGPTGTGGYKRNPSSIHAPRYSSCDRFVIVMSSKDVNELWSSSVSRFSLSGFFKRRYVSPESSVAVVSVPANMKSAPLLCSSVGFSPPSSSPCRVTKVQTSGRSVLRAIRL